MFLDNINLRILKQEDYTDDYLKWFSDPEVVRYSENRFKTFSKDGQLNYIKSFLEDDTKYLYGIFCKSKHIGNIELNQIDSNNLTANITYIIGSKEYWGKGIASFCINKVITKAKLEFGLQRVSAGCASKNIASVRVLQKNGFKLESTKKDFFIYENEKIDCLVFTKIL